MLSQKDQWSDLRPQSSVRYFLRQATHDYHVQLNQHPMLAGLTKPDYRLRDYLELLCAYKHLYQALESSIVGFLAQNNCGFDYRERQKLPWLLQDLMYFPETRTRTLPEYTLNPTGINNAAELIGVLYVIEGSTLGAQLISASLRKHHRLTPAEGARFFNGYGEHTTLKWQNFLAFAESIHQQQSSCLLAAESACRTFKFFHEFLSDFHQANPLQG